MNMYPWKRGKAGAKFRERCLLPNSPLNGHSLTIIYAPKSPNSPPANWCAPPSSPVRPLLVDLAMETGRVRVQRF